MKELELTWKRVIAVWWLLAWRGTLGSMVLAAVSGGIDGGFEAAMGASSRAVTLTTSITAGVLDIIWVFIVLRMALRKHYSDFRLAAVPD